MTYMYFKKHTQSKMIILTSIVDSTFPPIMIVRGTKSMFGFALSPADQTCIYNFIFTFNSLFFIHTIESQNKLKVPLTPKFFSLI